MDALIADSACSGTALFAGIKSIYGTLGYDSKAVYKEPSSVTPENEAVTVLQWAQDAGKDTGFVTTAKVTHATPAALYANSLERDWECDGDVEDKFLAMGIKDIAWQLINTVDFYLGTGNDNVLIRFRHVTQAPGNGTKVMLGGGRPAFFPKDVYEERYGGALFGKRRLLTQFGDDTWDCRRKDGQNLVQQWLESKGPKAKFVDDLDGLRGVDPSETDFLFGMFSENHVQWEDARDPAFDPSITDMTVKAIEVGPTF